MHESAASAVLAGSQARQVARSRRQCTSSRSAVRATRSTPRNSRHDWIAMVSGLVADPDAAEAVLVNTCGFIEAAKKDSIDTLLAAS